MTDVILAVDGGNSKTDVALVAEDGEVLGRVRGATISHQVIGARAGAERLVELVAEARSRRRVPAPSLGVYCLAGADFPSDLRLLKREFGRVAIAPDELILNDCFAPLRAGAQRGWGIALICGQGINGAGVAPDGRTARFAGIGDLSGDWGGGGGVGAAALASAIRARDGRGPRTSLEKAVPEHFGRRTAEAVMLDMYEGRVPAARRGELAPVAFREAAAGDEVARAIINRLADELAGMATALARRLRLMRLDTDVVLAGGVFKATDHQFYARLERGVRDVVPDARFIRPKVAPVGGAAMIGLDRTISDLKKRQAAARRVASALSWAGDKG